MTDLLERTRKIAGLKWQTSKVEDVSVTEEPSEIAFAKARKVANAIKIRPPLHQTTPAVSHDFSFHAVDLITLAAADPGDYDREFLFERITDAKRAGELSASLMERRKEANFPVDKWIESAIGSGECLVAVKEDDGTLAGFIAYSRELAVHAGDEDDEVEAVYTVYPEYLYISPEARNQNLSSALRAVVMSDVHNDLDHLSKKIAATRSKLPDFSFRSRITAEAYSSGGEYFLDQLHDNLADAVNQIFGTEKEPDECVERDYSC